MHSNFNSIAVWIAEFIALYTTILFAFYPILDVDELAEASALFEAPDAFFLSS